MRPAWFAPTEVLHLNHAFVGQHRHILCEHVYMELHVVVMTGGAENAGTGPYFQQDKIHGRG